MTRWPPAGEPVRLIPLASNRSRRPKAAKWLTRWVGLEWDGNGRWMSCAITARDRTRHHAGRSITMDPARPAIVQTSWGFYSGAASNWACHHWGEVRLRVIFDASRELAEMPGPARNRDENMPLVRPAAPLPHGSREFRRHMALRSIQRNVRVVPVKLACRGISEASASMRLYFHPSPLVVKRPVVLFARG